ncbi:MAG: hypothetical protein O7A03_01350 [Alphaproteobacteria bacterium]|nr:hypothetical protein [Alphaproteobacteria bacterium]
MVDAGLLKVYRRQLTMRLMADTNLRPPVKGNIPQGAEPNRN